MWPWYDFTTMILSGINITLFYLNDINVEFWKLHLETVVIILASSPTQHTLGCAKAQGFHWEKHTGEPPSFGWFMSYFRYVYCAACLLRLRTLLLWGPPWGQRTLLLQNFEDSVFSRFCYCWKSKIIPTPNISWASFLYLSLVVIVSSTSAYAEILAIIWLGYVSVFLADWEFGGSFQSGNSFPSVLENNFDVIFHWTFLPFFSAILS